MISYGRFHILWVILIFLYNSALDILSGEISSDILSLELSPKKLNKNLPV